MARRKRRIQLEVPRPTGRKRALEWGKNLLIILLACSAIILTGQSQLYSAATGSEYGWLGGLLRSFHENQGQPGPGGMELMSVYAAQPVRMAVCGGIDERGSILRAGVQYDAAAADKLFDQMSGYLSEALASAQRAHPVTEEAWRSALRSPGIYFDLLGSAPLRSLYAWLGEEGGENAALPADTGVRRILLAHTSGSTATLYYINENNGLYYACETSLLYEGDMQEAVEQYASSNTNGAAFAFEYGEQDNFSKLEPYVMVFANAPPEPRVYQASNPVLLDHTSQIEHLQRTLSFPNHYDVPEGVVIWEGSEKLRISRDGTATYHAATATEPRYPVGGLGDETAMIEAARKLAADTVGALCAEARIYLVGMTQNAKDGSWEIRFSYSLDGAPVLLPGGGYAAQFIVREGRIDEFTLKFRSYQDTGSRVRVLPERQAVAALGAMETKRRELALCYREGLDAAATAGWAAQ